MKQESIVQGINYDDYDEDFPNEYTYMVTYWDTEIYEEDGALYLEVLGKLQFNALDFGYFYGFVDYRNEHFDEIAISAEDYFFEVFDDIAVKLDNCTRQQKVEAYIEELYGLIEGVLKQTTEDKYNAIVEELSNNPKVNAEELEVIKNAWETTFTETEAEKIIKELNVLEDAANAPVVNPPKDNNAGANNADSAPKADTTGTPATDRLPATGLTYSSSIYMMGLGLMVLGFVATI